MNPSANGSHPIAGSNPFGTPTRMILLGYYDGPTDGILQFGDNGPVFRFVMPDEDEQLSRRSFPRDYAFSQLPPDALARLEEVLAEHITPIRPVWYINWQFDSAETERDVDDRVAAILAEASPPMWLATVPTSWTLENFCTSRVIALQLV